MSDDPNVLPYHHPEDKQYSLVFLTDDELAYRRRLDSETSKEHTAVKTYRDVVSGEDRFAIYTDTHRSRSEMPDFETEEELRNWLREEFDESLPVVQAVVIFYRELRGEEEHLEAYKKPDLDRIDDVLNTVNWRQSVPEVGAELLSEFILTHPMPNTNHRTGIVLLDRYLSSFDEEVSVPDTGEPGTWYDWAAEFVEDSKRLLTLRRRHMIFRYAEELGYDVIRRKNNVEIVLRDYDIHDTETFEHFTHEHRLRTREFVDTVLERTDAVQLRSVNDDGKRAFVNRL